MVDAETVRRRLRAIDDSIQALREIEARGRDAFDGSPVTQAATERLLQIAIQAVLDVAVHILAEDSAQTPEDYASSFTMLARMGVLGDELAKRLRGAAGLRNVLVHLYLDLDLSQVWAALQGLGDLEDFADAVQQYLSR